MDWKKPYIEACIDSLHVSNRGPCDFLEIGFGSGYAAARIQTFCPKSHTIIECDSVIAAKARAWAADRPGVTVIEDTWQEALPSLGIFDAIYFYDDHFTPQELRETKKEVANQLSFLQTITSAIKKIFNKIFDFHAVTYTDADVTYFFKKIEKKNAEQQKMVLRFFSDLHIQGQITQQQWDNACQDLEKRGWATAEEIAEAKERIIANRVRAKRAYLIAFLDICLELHMKKGSIFSCYVGDSPSWYDDPCLYEKIIINPSFDYTENWVEISVPQHCHNNRADRALVMTITKQI